MAAWDSRGLAVTDAAETGTKSASLCVHDQGQNGDTRVAQAPCGEMRGAQRGGFSVTD